MKIYLHSHFSTYNLTTEIGEVYSWVLSSYEGSRNIRFSVFLGNILRDFKKNGIQVVVNSNSTHIYNPKTELFGVGLSTRRDIACYNAIEEYLEKSNKIDGYNIYYQTSMSFTFVNPLSTAQLIYNSP